MTRPSEEFDLIVRGEPERSAAIVFHAGWKVVSKSEIYGSVVQP